MDTKEIAKNLKETPMQRKAPLRGLLVLLSSLFIIAGLVITAFVNQPWLFVAPGLVTYAGVRGEETGYMLSPQLTETPDACGVLVQTDGSGFDSIQSQPEWNAGAWQFSVALPDENDGSIIPYALYGNTFVTDGHALYPSDGGEGVTVLLASTEADSLRLSLHVELIGLNPSSTYLFGFLAGLSGDDLRPVGQPIAVSDIASCTLDTLWEPALSAVPNSIRCVVYCYSQTDAYLCYPSDTVVAPLDTVDDTSAVSPSAVPTALPTMAPTGATSSTPTILYSPTPTVLYMPTETPMATVQPTIQLPSSAVFSASPSPSASLLLGQQQPSSEVFTWYDADTRYWYHQLTETEKAVFAILYDGIMAFEDTIQIPISCTYEQLNTILYALYFDCPELFQLGLSNQVTGNLDADRIISVSPEYAFTQAQYSADLSALFAKLKSLASELYFGATEWERELAIYTHIKSICVYADDQQYSSTACGPFLKGEAICTGYSRALEIALRYYGIRCMEATGRSTSVNDPTVDVGHSWTYVRINGNWYQCDLTWDDISLADTEFQKYFPFLNLTDTQMLNSHVLDATPKSLAYPLCTSTEANYYVMLGSIILAGSDLKDAVFAAMTAAHQNNETEIPLAFESKADFDAALASIENILSLWKDGNTVIGCYAYVFSYGGQVLQLFNVSFWN